MGVLRGVVRLDDFVFLGVVWTRLKVSALLVLLVVELQERNAIVCWIVYVGETKGLEIEFACTLAIVLHWLAYCWIGNHLTDEFIDANENGEIEFP